MGSPPGLVQEAHLQGDGLGHDEVIVASHLRSELSFGILDKGHALIHQLRINKSVSAFENPCGKLINHPWFGDAIGEPAEAFA